MSDEESLCDTASVLSLNSDRGSYEEGENGNSEDHDDGSVIGMQSREALEEKIAEAIDGMTEKSANVRATSLATLITLLSQQFLPDLMLGRRETLRDNLEKIFKRGQRSEQGLAATVYCLTLLQVGPIDIDLASEDFNAIKPCLQSLLLDHTVPIPVRVKCCQALCFGAFLAESCTQDISNLLTILEPLFGAGGKGKKNGAITSEDDVNGDSDDVGASPSKTKIPKTSNCSLASAAIAGWSLLITLMSREYLALRVHRFTRNMQELLDQAELEVRLNAGEALAILVELCELVVDESDDTDHVASSDESEEGVNGISHISNGHTNGHANGNGYTNGHSAQKTNMKSLINKLRELSTESHKYRNKKDRRQQRHSFRDYLHAVEEGDGPGLNIKFGYGEVLEVESWVKKRQYDAICQVLVSGINRHLLENPLVRQVLELGAPRLSITDGSLGTKQAKNERHYLNACNFKARSVSRGKSRDHRMADLADY